ncbi:flagellum-specific ATP synthase [Buchnera aphidicola str. Bp (Baizongia pistaciae)]|uniref:Flagellum-specific ATP synthase n=1 Tax=Buchnera aphidicola subsp. Baizongia pistaciae (strain Bp) TaxID=224915 RepID=FLII_BUCBP|nr:FliI/YscN family ATPase [Buchnera aphidicola]Q89AZ7.1 RecName: Full=Flagellum-specific ATP synthase [Buchnera aphidicola str. Bp (Baizongia pistaciae)]AAO26807.1 flagellum-specific ATP synthase [Buchnera aphidicola str. Bp (Baizongia pistaciae)]
MNLRIKKWLEKLDQFEKILVHMPSIMYCGKLIGINGLVLEVSGLKLPIGTICIVEKNNSILDSDMIEAEVIGFRRNLLLLLLLSNVSDLTADSKVTPKILNGSYYNINKLPVCDKLLGRIVDGLGKPLDNFSKIDSKYNVSLTNVSINPLHREPVTHVLDTGIRSINGLLTIGRGQKIGLFASSGLGKSVLLGMMTRYTQADIVILSLIGERGREVKEFIDSVLTETVLSRSIVISAPSESSVLMQTRGAIYAMRIAEYFRDKNFHVLLIMDSLTRYAMAHREISLSIGELPVSKGYPPSVFSKLFSLIERAGNGKINSGSITAFFTVLTEEEERYDPISESARSILDGHIILSREYAESGHYPAINIENSISRVMPNIVDSSHYSFACHFKKIVSLYQRNRDLINVGAYISGTDPDLDMAITLIPKLNKFLQQGMLEKSNFLDSKKSLYSLFN